MRSSLYLFGALVVLSGWAGRTASAQGPDVAGAVTGGLVLADGDPGGVAVLDVWAPIGVLRLGGFLGAGAIVSDRDERNRVMMPVGVSAALVFDGDVVVSLRARGGVWGGSTQDVKLTLGGFVAGGAGLGLHLSPGVTISAVFEVWGIFGAGETWAVVPGLSLEWGHPEEVEEEEGET